MRGGVVAGGRGQAPELPKTNAEHDFEYDAEHDGHNHDALRRPAFPAHEGVFRNLARLFLQHLGMGTRANIAL
jgi:hypothetical protein